MVIVLNFDPSECEGVPTYFGAFSHLSNMALRVNFIARHGFTTAKGQDFSSASGFFVLRFEFIGGAFVLSSDRLQIEFAPILRLFEIRYEISIFSLT